MSKKSQHTDILIRRSFSIKIIDGAIKLSQTTRADFRIEEKTTEIIKETILGNLRNRGTMRDTITITTMIEGNTKKTIERINLIMRSHTISKVIRIITGKKKSNSIEDKIKEI